MSVDSASHYHRLGNVALADISAGPPGASRIRTWDLHHVSSGFYQLHPSKLETALETKRFCEYVSESNIPWV